MTSAFLDMPCRLCKLGGIAPELTLAARECKGQKSHHLIFTDATDRKQDILSR